MPIYIYMYIDSARGGDDPVIATPASIHEKYDKMDEFLKVMFTMACKWKHGKDVLDKMQSCQ